MENNLQEFIFKESIKVKGRRPIKYVITETGCHNCTSHRLDRDGYPRISYKGKDWLLSRYIYTLLHGDIPNGMVIRHKCDNPTCINPEHLELGTVQDNIRDKMIRRRQPKGYKPKKITPELEIEILSDSRSSLQISISLGLDYRAVLRVKSGQRKEYNSTSKPHSNVIGEPRKRKKRPNNGRDGQGRKAA